jgi:hypothetical protein
MPEIKTPPRIDHDENGDELVTFGPEHSWADVARWICQNESDRMEMQRLLAEAAEAEAIVYAEERDALKAEVERLRTALLEQAMPCTCREAYSGRGLQDPECPAGEYGDDCRAAIGLSPLCQFNISISALQENTND